MRDFSFRNVIKELGKSHNSEKKNYVSKLLNVTIRLNNTIVPEMKILPSKNLVVVFISYISHTSFCASVST